MTSEELWQFVLADLQLSISKANFATWFKDTRVISHENDLVVVGVPNTFAKEWLENKYNKFVLKSLREVNSSIRIVNYVVASSSIKTGSADDQSRQITHSRLVPALVINNGGSSFGEVQIGRDTNLNQKYGFENFVIGSFNEIAHAAAQVIVKNPGAVYNPLFVYGGVGVGKTHLLQATGNALLVLRPSLVVRYIPAEKFTEDVVNSIRTQTMDNMRAQYHQIDVLIIDDVQFLAGKDKTQEELFYVFNSLYQKNKQIIFSSDRPPKAIPAIEERLRSRFEGGMIADIGIPDFETRLAILRTKAGEKGVSFPDEIFNFIATNVQKNIRELEGALTRVLAYTQSSPNILTTQDIQKILKNLVAPPKRIISPKKILEVISEFYDVPLKDLLSKKRQKEIVRPRQIGMYLLREELQSSYPFIGVFWGGKDHTTVIHACEKITKEVEEKESSKEEVMLIRQRLYNV